MKFPRLLLFAILLLITVNAITVFAQEIKELKKQASQLYEDKNFHHALKAYEVLDSLLLDDINIKYRYAVCLITVYRNIPKAIDYLNLVIAQRPDDSDARYYLGKAYHFSNQLELAIEQYKKGLEGSLTVVSKEEVKRSIACCTNAAFFSAILSK